MRLFGAAALITSTGCGSEPGSKSGTRVAPGTPIYVVETTVSSGDDELGYLVPIAGALGRVKSFNLDDAIEIGDSTIAGWDGAPYVYAGASDAPTITRWALQPDGTLSKDGELNFSDLGISHAAVDNGFFYAKDKAYMPDDDNRQLIVWNPETMQLVGTIPLGVENDGPLLPWTSLTVGQTEVLVSVSWEEDFSSDWSRFGDHVELITIDPNTDTVVDRKSDTRSNYAFWGSVGSDGAAYFSPMSYYAPIRSMLGEDAGVSSVALRVLPGEHAFDPGYNVDLSALVGGRPAGDLLPISDQVALIRAWHSDLVSAVAGDKSNWQDVLNEAGFLFWRWELGSDKAELIPDQPPGASEITSVYHVDGRALLPRVNADYSASELEELTPDGRFQTVLQGPGNFWGVVRVR
ncbi:MAG TPA: hypothetical protein VHC69_06325 [Polyangiaceae bacterium]|nr:hypothetical protein [Polyangiaceae bacterium]